MIIEKIVIENYKGFCGIHEFDLTNNLVCFVGENNTGKSTVFEAIDFLKSGLPEKRTPEELKNKMAAENEHISVTIILKNDINAVISDFSDSRYNSYIYNSGDGVERLKLRRSTAETTVRQNGKEVRLDVKKITVWNNTEGQFENPTGFDSAIKTLFDPQFIWSDINPNDVVDFGSTKTCGKLLSAVFSDFQKTPLWTEFMKAHTKTFSDSSEPSLSNFTKSIESEIEEVFASQYGSAHVEFKFPAPDPVSFLKVSSISIDDGIETELRDKGSGMQRSIALAILQVYAKRLAAHPSDSTKVKPLFFFIDEPEISLHPRAQKQLLKSLKEISNIHQVFITTHSPSMVDTAASLIVFSKDTTTHDISHISKQVPVTTTISPSISGILFSAFMLATIDYHDELFNELLTKNIISSVSALDVWFEKQGLIKDRSDGRGNNETLPVSIRNKSHHGDNTARVNYTEDELAQSINIMIRLI